MRVRCTTWLHPLKRKKGGVNPPSLEKILVLIRSGTNALASDDPHHQSRSCNQHRISRRLRHRRSRYQQVIDSIITRITCRTTQSISQVHCRYIVNRRDRTIINSCQCERCGTSSSTHPKTREINSICAIKPIAGIESGRCPTSGKSNHYILKTQRGEG